MRGALVIGALAVLAAFAPAASAARAPDFLARSLDSRGCAHEPGAAPSANLTAWVMLALAAAHRDTSRPHACLAAHARDLRRPTDIEIAALAVVAAGGDPRATGGRDLVAAIRAQLRGGRIGPTIASNQFGILALRAAGAPVPASARRALLGDQRRDGAWPVARGGDGDSNLTASGIQAAIAAGVPVSARAVRRARAALGRFRSEGGYELMAGAGADAQSTGWALQALAAVGASGAEGRAWLRGVQRADGSFAYQPGLAITPVWVTAQAVLGYAGRPFPLAP